MRGGFSLIELMVAIVLLSVGMLALAGSAATIVRTMASAEMETQRTQLVHSRMDALRSGGCGQVGSGSATSGGISLSWTSEAIPRGVVVTIASSYASRGSYSQRTYRTVLAC